MAHRTIERLSVESLLIRHRAFWEGTPVDRPLLDVVRSRTAPEIKDTWLTPDMLSIGSYVDAIQLASRSGSLIQGDLFRAAPPQSNVPWMEAIVGAPIYVADLAGVGMWPKPRPFEWSGVASVRPAPDNPWLARLLEYTRELVAAWDGTYLVTHCLMRGTIDMASAILGDLRMNLAFSDHPVELGELLGACADAFIQVARAQWEMIPPFHEGYCSMNGLWAPGTPVRLQADSASQISGRTYREHVLPHDRRIMEAFEFNQIDLHSGATLRLADELLDLPCLKAISVSIDPYGSAPSISQLVPAFARILERKRLIINGQMVSSDLKLLVDSLPPTGLAILARLQD